MGIKKEFFNTPVMDAIQMTHFSDEDILKNSKGEVKKIIRSDHDEEDDFMADRPNGTDIDPEIFGELNEENLKHSKNMGHIKLIEPALNINYLYGTKPILPSIIGLSRKDIERVAYFAGYLVTDKIEGNHKIGEVLDEQTYQTLSEADRKSGKVAMGAGAIETYMKTKGISTKNIILHYIPVPPYAFRFEKINCKKHGTVYRPSYLSTPLFLVLHQNHRYKRLSDMGAPEIIIRNEKRMLQEYIDCYINNGARGYAKLNRSGVPYESLQGAYQLFIDKFNRTWSMDEFDDDTVKVLLEKVNAIGKLYPDPEKKEWDGMLLEDEFTEKEDKIYEEIMELHRPIFTKIIEKRFPDYRDFHDRILSDAERSLHEAIEGFIYFVFHDHEEVKNDTDWLKDEFYSGIIPSMDLRVRHIAFV